MCRPFRCFSFSGELRTEHHPIIFMQCGPVRYLVDAKSQAFKHTFSHFVIPRFTRTRLLGADTYQHLCDGIMENDARNELILSDVRKLIQNGRTSIGHPFAGDANLLAWHTGTVRGAAAPTKTPPAPSPETVTGQGGKRFALRFAFQVNRIVTLPEQLCKGCLPR